MSLQSDERREYFRIKNWIVINYEAIESLDSVPPIDDVAKTSSPKIRLLQELTRLENENQAYLGSLTDKQSQLGNYLLNLNKKLELLTQFAVESLQTDAENLTEVDISGGGLRFTCADKYDIDQLLKIEVILVPECVGIVAYARVVDSRAAENGKGFETALIFVKLNEAHRDAIIKHVFQVQSKQLRENKEKPQDSDEN